MVTSVAIVVTKVCFLKNTSPLKTMDSHPPESVPSTSDPQHDNIQLSPKPLNNVQLSFFKNF